MKANCVAGLSQLRGVKSSYWGFRASGSVRALRAVPLRLLRSEPRPAAGESPQYGATEETRCRRRRLGSKLVVSTG